MIVNIMQKKKKSLCVYSMVGDLADQNVNQFIFLFLKCKFSHLIFTWHIDLWLIFSNLLCYKLYFSFSKICNWSFEISLLNVFVTLKLLSFLQLRLFLMKTLRHFALDNFITTSKENRFTVSGICWHITEFLLSLFRFLGGHSILPWFLFSVTLSFSLSDKFKYHFDDSCLIPHVHLIRQGVWIHLFVFLY